MARPFPILVILVVALSMVAAGLAWPALAQPGQGQGSGGAGSPGGPLGATTSSATIEDGNDAGSGMDAGDTPASPLAIDNAQRTWSANLTPAGSDADWYNLDAASAFCAVGTVTTQSPGSVTLTADAARSTSAYRPTQPHQAARVALAVTAGHLPLLGVEAPSLSSLSEEEGNGGGGPPTPSRYTFAFSSHTYAQLDPEGDGESPEAGASPLSAAPLPADCAAGRLSAASGDAIDTYQFAVEDVRDMTFSFAIAAGEPAQARVVSPTGVTVATIADGAASDVWADEPGTWTVVVEPLAAPAPAALAHALALPGFGATPAGGATLEQTTYLLGVTDGPDPEPCRPAC